MKVVFVSIPSKGCFRLDGELNRWVIDKKIEIALAKLHEDEPHVVFISPSVQNYVILHRLRAGPTYDEWRERCRTILARCDELVVLCFDGWKESTGVTDEIAIAHELNINVVYKYPHELVREH